MMDSPVSALYHALHNVYSPLLLKDAKWSNEFDPKLQVCTIWGVRLFARF